MLNFIIFYIILSVIVVSIAFYLVVASFLGDWKLAKDIIIFEKTINTRDKKNIINERILNRLSFEEDTIKLSILKEIVDSRYTITILDDKYFMGSISNWLNFLISEELNLDKVNLNNNLIEFKYDFLINKYLRENYGYYIR